MLTQRALTWGQMLNGVRSAPTALALPLPLTHAHAHARALGRGAWLARTAARSIREVAFGKRHVAILTFSGEVWTMGAGEDGALGHGDTLPVSTPRRVELLVGRTLSAVACGVAHTATLTAEHEAVLWGLNSSGQLGTGDTVLCAVPYSAPAVASLPPIGARTAARARPAGRAHRRRRRRGATALTRRPACARARGAARAQARSRAAARTRSSPRSSARTCGSWATTRCPPPRLPHRTRRASS